MAFPKFILTNHGVLRLGMVNLHKDLLLEGERCMGGGYYKFDFAQNKLRLSGQSTDFGSPRWDHFDRLLVPSVYRGLRLVYSPTGDDDGFDIGDMLQIEYAALR